MLIGCKCVWTRVKVSPGDVTWWGGTRSDLESVWAGKQRKRLWLGWFLTDEDGVLTQLNIFTSRRITFSLRMLLLGFYTPSINHITAVFVCSPSLFWSLILIQNICRSWSLFRSWTLFRSWSLFRSCFQTSVLQLNNKIPKQLCIFPLICCSTRPRLFVFFYVYCSWKCSFPTVQSVVLFAPYSCTLDFNKMMTVRINCWLSALIRGCLRAACLLWRQRAGYFTVCVQKCADAVSWAALVVFNYAVMDRLKSMIRPLADIYSRLRVNFPASLFLSTLNSSHFLLGNRWETGRRGNEQEERQTLCKQWRLLKKLLISPSVCLHAIIQELCGSRLTQISCG